LAPFAREPAAVVRESAATVRVPDRIDRDPTAASLRVILEEDDVTHRFDRRIRRFRTSG